MSGSEIANPPPAIWNVIEAAKAMVAEPYANVNVIKALRQVMARLTEGDVIRVDLIVAHWAGYDMQFSLVGDAVVFRPNTDSEPMFWWAATIAAMLEHGGVSGGQPVSFPLFVSTAVAANLDTSNTTATSAALSDVTRLASLFRLAVESVLAGCTPDHPPERPRQDIVDAHFAAGMPRIAVPASGLPADDAHLAMAIIKNFSDVYPHTFDWSDDAPGVRFINPIGSRLLMAFKLVCWITPPDIVHAVRVNGISPTDALTIAGVACQADGLSSDERDAWRDLAAEMLQLASGPEC